MDLQDATIDALLNEASYSRIYQHTQDDSTFAIIGSEDKDTGKNRKKELYDLIRGYKAQSGARLGFNQAKGLYTYMDNGTEKRTSQEDSLIVYDIDKQDALDIANKLNQESIVWKDKNFFGVLYSNGDVMTTFKNIPGGNMNFSGTEQAGFGTKLKNDDNSLLGFKFEGSIIYPTNYDTEEPEIENFIFYGE